MGLRRSDEMRLHMMVSTVVVVAGAKVYVVAAAADRLPSVMNMETEGRSSSRYHEQLNERAGRLDQKRHQGFRKVVPALEKTRCMMMPVWAVWEVEERCPCSTHTEHSMEREEARSFGGRTQNHLLHHEDPCGQMLHAKSKTARMDNYLVATEVAIHFAFECLTLPAGVPSRFSALQ